MNRTKIESYLIMLEQHGSIKFDNTICICTHESLDSKASYQKNYIQFSNHYIQKFYDLKYHLVWFCNGLIFAKPIESEKLKDYIDHYSSDVTNRYKELIELYSDSKYKEDGNATYSQMKSVVFVNSYSEIKHLIINEIFKSKNTDFLINNRVIKVNVKNNNFVEVMYNTTNSQNNYDTFIYDEILIPQILED